MKVWRGTSAPAGSVAPDGDDVDAYVTAQHGAPLHHEEVVRPSTADDEERRYSTVFGDNRLKLE
jgi:hypothetical protein